MSTRRKLDVRKYHQAHRADLKVEAVAVNNERAGRKAYPAQALDLCDKEGNQIGSISFRYGQIEIYLDPRLEARINYQPYYFPQAQTERNNDAQIMTHNRASLKAERAAGHHLPPSPLGLHLWNQILKRDTWTNYPALTIKTSERFELTKR